MWCKDRAMNLSNLSQFSIDWHRDIVVRRHHSLTPQLLFSSLNCWTPYYCAIVSSSSRVLVCGPNTVLFVNSIFAEGCDVRTKHNSSAKHLRRSKHVICHWVRNIQCWLNLGHLSVATIRDYNWIDISPKLMFTKNKSCHAILQIAR